MPKRTNTEILAVAVQKLHGSVSLVHANQAEPCQFLGESIRKDTQALTQLLGQLQALYPQAGSRYYSTRLWTLAIWQAIYLSIAATQQNLVFTPEKLRQCVRNNSVYGFQLSTEPEYFNGSQHQLLAINAKALRAFINQSFETVSALLKLCRANCYGLVADTVNIALLSHTFEHSPTDLHTQSEQWQVALQLVNRQGKPRSVIKEQAQSLQLIRCSCCRHHLTGNDPKLFCEDCPLDKRRRNKTLKPQQLTSLSSPLEFSNTTTALHSPQSKRVTLTDEKVLM